MKRTLLLVGAALGLGGCSVLGPARPDVTVTVIGVNDLHGHLLPTSLRVPDPADRARTLTVQAGGVETIGGILAETRRANPNTVFVGVGDLTGASPPISARLRDEPTVLALSRLGLAVSVVGDHEFDSGMGELRRLQKGGCDPGDPARSCRYENPFPGAGYTYIGANVLDDQTGARVLPAYRIVRVGPARVAFVGAALRDTPAAVPPPGVAGLRFEDEVAAINRVIPQIRRGDVDAIIALVHQGGVGPDASGVVDCKTLTGPIVDIARRLDPAVSAIMTGHTHRAYACRVPGPNGQERVVVQGGADGHLLQRLDLSLDTRRKQVVSVRARIILVDAANGPRDPAMTALVQRAQALTDPGAGQTALPGAEPSVRAPRRAAPESP